MSKNIPLPNFAWKMEGLLAVGDVPDSTEALDWLLAQGFRAVVSLGKISANLTEQIMKSGIGYYCVKWNEAQKDSYIVDIMEYIASCFYCQEPVYICCSNGNEIASGIAEGFVAQKDLHIVNYLGLRANDLNHGDDFDWTRGHAAFYGHNIYQAICALTAALSNPNPEIQFAAADTLTELMEHVGHGCFPQAAVQALVKVRTDVQDIVLKRNPEYQAAYEDIFRRFDKLT